MAEQNEFKYDVAISFLGSDLDLAVELRNRLRDRMNAFLFTERQGEIAGSDGMETLSAVFEREARLAVILHRAEWGTTPWTRVEETAIKNKGLRQGWDFVLVIPLDENPKVPPFIPKTQIWLSYLQYGLKAALPVLERKLEELGGTAKPVTPQSRAQEFKRHAEWKAKAAQLRRSQEGVDAAREQVSALFSELKNALSEGGGAQFSAKGQQAARIWSDLPNDQGSTVTIRWSQQWGNVLDQSGLHVSLWQGYAGAVGERLMTFEQPVELQEHAFDFEYTEAGVWMWKHRNTQRIYDAGHLGAYCIGLLLDHISAR